MQYQVDARICNYLFDSQSKLSVKDIDCRWRFQGGTSDKTGLLRRSSRVLIPSTGTPLISSKLAKWWDAPALCYITLLISVAASELFGTVFSGGVQSLLV